MSSTTVRTVSGSRYTVAEREGRYFLLGDNVANPHSVQLAATQEWEILKPAPWPPVLGEELTMVARTFFLPTNDPDRMPGGGKITSPVTEIINGL